MTLIPKISIDKEIEECEKYIEMFKVILEGYEKRLNRLKKEIKNGKYT